MDHSDHDDGGKDGSFGSRVVPHLAYLVTASKRKRVTASKKVGQALQEDA
jgi:hypothetical protein